ncbi:MAG: TlpA family protein disulfide reductase [Akkermansia sp.]|nr:TlpA family protein disulfide reductase [Akkermansia sp.]
MKRTLLLIAMLLGVCCWSLPQQAMADDTTSGEVSKTKKKKKKSKKKKDKKAKEEAEEAATEAEAEAEAELSVVAKALEGAEYLTNTRPNLKAKFYIFLNSASWCGPCNAEMPEVVKCYEEMKRSGQVELILQSADSNPGDAVGFMNKFGATFPAIPKGKMPQLANIKPGPGIPWANILDADGNNITSGHGGIIRQWKQHTIKDAPIPDAAPETEDTADDSDKTPAVHAAIAKTKFFNAKPSKKADYYIYLHSASWCGPCKALMPEIIKEYKKMKRKGVEIILLGHDKTEDAAKAYLKSYKAKFAGVLDNSPDARSLPGYTPASGIPAATIVDKNGKVITSGHGSIVLEWKDHCKKKD